MHLSKEAAPREEVIQHPEEEEKQRREEQREYNNWKFWSRLVGDF